jgi:ATP-dependent HslUV protease ATP-binding subunit HslU
MENTRNAVVVEDLTPRQIVERLDAYIIGQHKAKKAVAIALRNRARRLKLPEEIRDEIIPKNILMIGPTGVGKTEIARRLAKLCNAPFLKVEATKYTEVGYVGRDVESMVRDLAAVAVNMVKAEMQEGFRKTAEGRAEEDLLDLLLPGSKKEEKKSKRRAKVSETVISVPASSIGNELKALFEKLAGEPNSGVTKVEDKPGEEPVLLPASADAQEPESAGQASAETEKAAANSTREKFRVMLRNGELEERTVDITVQRRGPTPSMEIFAGGNMEDMEGFMQNITSMMTGGGNRRKTVTVAEARRILLEEQLDRMVDPDKVADEAKHRVEQAGIIFIDEIDKIAVRGEHGGQDVSREGVQRDILPIVEGSNVNTRYGVIDTTHILFIGAGAFTLAKPSDLIPELQGRFPLRVELDSLNVEDFKRILLEPKNAITKQYAELLSTENVTIKFGADAIDRMSFLAADVNTRAENIGARRLHTIIETVLEEISYEADVRAGETIEITAAYVDERLKDIVEDQDLSRYIL